MNSISGCIAQTVEFKRNLLIFIFKLYLASTDFLFNNCTDCNILRRALCFLMVAKIAHGCQKKNYLICIHKEIFTTIFCFTNLT